MASKANALVYYQRDKVNSYKMHEDGSYPMSAFVESDKIRRPCLQAAYQVIGIARGLAPKNRGRYASSFGIGKRKVFLFKPAGEPRQRRAVVEVINTDPAAGAIEWGSGRPNEGASPGEPRPQGGSNQPFRVLGRAAAKVGDFHE
jgi:hypothetical protein